LKERIGGERRPKDRVKTGYSVDNCIVLPPSPPLSLSLTFPSQDSKSYDKNTHAFERPLFWSKDYL